MTDVKDNGVCLLCKGTGTKRIGAGVCRQCSGSGLQPEFKPPTGPVFASATHKACKGEGCEGCNDGVISGVLLPGETADVFELGDKLNEGSTIEQEHMDREDEKDD